MTSSDVETNDNAVYPEEGHSHIARRSQSGRTLERILTVHVHAAHKSLTRDVRRAEDNGDVVRVENMCLLNPISHFLWLGYRPQICSGPPWSTQFLHLYSAYLAQIITVKS